MSKNISRRTLAKGAAWSAPVAAIAAAAPAHAASGVAAQCTALPAKSCWPCDNYAYVFGVFPGYGQTQLQTSSPITWTAADTQTITITYTLTLPAGVSLITSGSSKPTKNGSWGVAGTWTGPTVSGNTVTVTVKPDGNDASICGGINLNLNSDTFTSPATLEIKVEVGTTKCGGTSYSFVPDATTNIASYGAAGNCQSSGGAVWTA